MKITFDGMRAVRWLSDHPNETQLPKEVFDAETSKAVFLELVDSQYVHDDRTIDESYSFILTDAGSLVGRNTRLQYRAEVAQRAVLQSIGGNKFNGLVDEAGGSDFTGPLDERELTDATEELFDAKLIDGQRGASGRFSYVEITARGRKALRNPYPLTESSADDRSHVTTNYSADNHGTIGNQVVGGAGHIVTSHIQQGISIEAVIEALRDIRNELHDPVEGDPAVDVAEDLDSVIRSGARRGWDWLKTELHNVVGSLALAGRQELADRAQDVLRQIGT